MMYQVEIPDSVMRQAETLGDTAINTLAHLSTHLRSAPLDVGEQDGPSALMRSVELDGFRIRFLVGHPIRAVVIRRIEASQKS